MFQFRLLRASLAALALGASESAVAQAGAIRLTNIEVGPAGVAIDLATDLHHYYVLDRLDLTTGSPAGIVDLGLGVQGGGRLVDSAPPQQSGLYQVRAFSAENPGDLDGDGMDDVYELGRPELDPLDPSDASRGIRFDGESATELGAYLHNYEVGRGMHDITGVVANGSMMGYAEGNQKSKGIHDRQWARAFIVRDRRPPHRRVVYVVVDNGQTFQSITQGVHEKIRADNELKDHYSYENIVMSATHTHGAAGGHSHFALLHATVGGYSWRTYDAIVHGIYMAIKKAHRDLEPGSIRRNRSQLDDANENRRPNAFLQNVEHAFPALLGNPYALENGDFDNRDKEMFLLRFGHRDSGEIAAFNWFPVHGVSVSKFNSLLTGDNKGYAAYRFEQEKEAIYPGHEGYDSNVSTFVAGFSNSNPGDLTANRRTLEAPWPEPPEAPILGIGWPGDYGQPGEYGPEEDYERATRIGGRQFTKALALHNGTEGSLAKVTGPIDYRHLYFDLSAVSVDPPSIYPYNIVGFPGSATSPPWRTCHGAYGVEFAKGTLDGEGLLDAGAANILIGLSSPFDGAFEACQVPKDVFIRTTGDNGGLMGNWLPISILRVGDVVILAVPAEFTVMAAWRLKKTVEGVFASEGQTVYPVLAGLSNSYSGYVTTYEEYLYEELVEGTLNQGYEAASTHFGAFTLAAYQTKFAELSRAMATGNNPPAAPNTITMPAHVKPDVPFVNPTDTIPVLDIAPLPGGVPATYHEPAGCPTGQLHDLPSGDCFSCPAGYNRLLLLPITDPEVCEKPAESEFRPATEHSAPGCPVGQFFEVFTGDCWSCPAGFNQSVFPAYDPISGQPTGNGCHKPASAVYTAAESTTSSGGTDCPAGYVYDFILGRCYRCPASYAKNVLRSWDSPSACEREESTSAQSTAGTGLFGTDCPAGYVFDFGLGRCYRCPSTYSKHVLRAWNAGNACIRTGTTSAQSTTSSGGTDCPNGYVYDFILGRCYRCPTNYNKYILRAWDHPETCERIIPEEWSAATRHGSGTCPAGQFLDIGLGTCWSCPSGFNRTVFAVDGSLACEKVHPPEYAAATIFGKAACEARNPDWFLDIGRNECWSCPDGSIRNLNPVTSDEACTKALTFGDMKANPAASYSRGSLAQASFWAGHPKNVFGTFSDGLVNGVDTFFKVQRRVNGVWRTVRTDADWDTEYSWEPQGLSGGAACKWLIPGNADTGTYRILHQGYHSSNDGVTPYSGTSPEFQVTN